MGGRLIDATTDDRQPIIKFDVEIEPNQVISYEGYEFICSNPKCDCQTVNIGIALKGTDFKSILMYITYGWHNYEYYVNQGHDKDYAREMVQGTFNNPSDGKSERNRSILLAFREWLRKNKEYYDQIFEDQYKRYKSGISSRKLFKERNSKLKKLFSLMLELFGEKKVEEFIASCKQEEGIRK